MLRTSKVMVLASCALLCATAAIAMSKNRSGCIPVTFVVSADNAGGSIKQPVKVRGGHQAKTSLPQKQLERFAFSTRKEAPLFKDSLVFSASFDGTTRAQSLGKTVTGSIEGPELYRESRFGKALVVGDAGARVSYPSVGIIGSERGAIELWFNPVDWTLGSKPFFNILFETDAPRDLFLIYKYGDRFRFFAADRESHSGFVAHGGPIEKGSFHHLVAVWENGIGTVYLDGKPSASAPIDTTVGVGSRFYLSDHSFVARNEDERSTTLIDECRIYNRALSADEVAQLYLHNRAFDSSASNYIRSGRARLTASGTIDWSSAAKLAGFVDDTLDGNEDDNAVLASQDMQPSVAVCWDDKRLHFRFEHVLGSGKVLQARATGRDANLNDDDTIHIDLQRSGLKMAYHFACNRYGTIADSRQKSGEPVSLDWNGDWQVNSSLENGVWILEASISFKALDAASPNADDQTLWSVSFGRSTPIASGQRRNVSWTGMLALADGLSVCGMDALRVEDGAYSLDAFVVPSADSLPLAAFVAIGDGGSARIERTIPLIASHGKRHAFSYSGKLPNGADRIAVIFLDNDKIQTRFVVPIQRIPSNLFSLTLRPSNGIAEVRMAIDPKTSWDQARVRLLKDNSVVKELFAKNENYSSPLLNVPIAELSVSNYCIAADVHISGKWVEIGRKNFLKPDAPWTDNTIGVKQINDAPPSPWTPTAVSVTADALLVDCWGRRISFNRQSPLPTGMTSQGVELLNSPVVLKAGSESVVWQSNGVASSGPSGVVVEATGQIGGRLVYATTTIEFDGMMFTEIKPASGAPAWSPFSQLVIEVPMRRVVTPYMQKQGFMPDSSVVLNTTPGWSEDIGFQNYIWFGNDATGLSWFCESRRSWTASSTRQLGVENRGDATVLIVRIAEGSSAALTKLAFGLHPTPTRERPSKWRDISYVGGQKFNFIWASPAYYKYHGYPQVADNPASFISVRDNIKNAGKLAIPYLHSSMLDINAPEYAYFGQEWENTGQGYSNPDGFSTQLVQTRPDSPGWNDFIVWRYKSFVEQYNLDGIYHDFAAPSANTNPLLPETLGDMPIRAWRDLSKRLYIMLKEMPKPTFYIQHTSINSGGLCSPLLSFCDMYVDNEQTAAVVEGNSPEWVYSGLPESYWRIRSTGKQYGCAPLNILIQNKFTPGCIGLQLLYDIHSSWGWFGTKTAEATAVLNNVETAMRTFGIGQDNVQYLPPWANTLVSLSNAGADVRVAAYLRGTKAMLVIVNGSTAAANNVGVTLKPETGLTIYGVKDAISQETLTLSGPSSFTLNIGPLDFRLILLDFGSQP